ncbi:hypothetical protein J437_LFUL005943 [Ladona fulva]|uniref:Uncharacterized protein n=1 Tax=Ladona fulva TaxID=123851 RepID=A0A8K0NXD7_LADFU|nr:hypothetical protein J437_LFUL005943 [Ladona fulva]
MNRLQNYWKTHVLFNYSCFKDFQLIRGKCHKYSIKLFLFAESTGFIHKMIACTDSQDMKVGEKVIHQILY